MATHSSILAWEIPWTEEPDGLQYMGSPKSRAWLSDWAEAAHYASTLIDWISSPNILCDAGKDWRQEEQGVTEDEMVGWHHRFNGHEFDQTLGDCEGQGSLVCWNYGISKSQTWLSDWATNTILKIFFFKWIIFESLHCICYSTASVFVLGFLAPR